MGIQGEVKEITKVKKCRNQLFFFWEKKFGDFGSPCTANEPFSIHQIPQYLSLLHMSIKKFQQCHKVITKINFFLQ